jgi:hypothetical protein
MAVAFALIVALDRLPELRGSRILSVGTPNGYASIGDALSAASASDIVQVEPGEYAEAIALDNGVQLAARVPGSVTLTALPGRPDWISIAVRGRGSRISGIQVLGRTDAPIATGIALEGYGLLVDDVTFEGNLDVALDIQANRDAVIRASRFSGVRGLAVRIGPSATPALRQNLFQRGADEHGPALHVQEGAVPMLEGNVFVGYADAIGAPAARRQQLLHGNFVIRGSDYGAR